MMSLLALIAFQVQGGCVASLTIRGLDESLKSLLRVEAARQGISMEEAARRILRNALATHEVDTGGLGSRVHQYFAEIQGYDLEIPARAVPRAGLDLFGRTE